MRKVLLCSAVALLVAGCKDGGTTPPVATTVAVSPGTVSLNAIGATQVVHAAVVDQKGKPMPGAPISWTSSAASVTVVGAGGDSAVVTAAGNGAATITATAGSATGSTTVQVAQVAAALEKGVGDLQTGAAGTVLPTPLRVAVRDRLGAPVAGVTVALAVYGGGTLSGTSAVSAADGNATVQWTVGTVAGAPQMVVATVPGVTEVTFTATAVPGPAASSAVSAGNEQNATPGSPVPVAPRVVVRDAFNNGVAGVNVQFTVSAGGGSVTGPATVTDGIGNASVGSWTLGGSPGSNTLTATFPGTALPPVVFSASAAATGSLTVAGGNNQGAMAGTAVPTAPSVRVRDAGGIPIAGLTVTFAVTAGGGTVGNATATSDANGVASAGSWTLGAATVNTLRATVAGVTAAPVDFRGVGCEGGGGAGYALTLCYTTTMSTSQRDVFRAAAARWATVITGDLPNVTGTMPGGSCSPGQPTLTMTYDDLVIFAGVENIDGPGGVLGSAGPCFIRGTNGLPLGGVMRFDAADVANLEAGGGLSSVILHEMGHVLGIGTFWSRLGLLQNPSTASASVDTWFSGANGIAGFNSIGGATYTGGQKVPVENTGGAGTMNGHWRESVLANELMTGFLDNGSNPMSLLTVRSLTDMGYTVDIGAADAFSVSLSLRAAGSQDGPRIKLHNDLYTGPVFSMTPQGRVTRLPR